MRARLEVCASSLFLITCFDEFPRALCARVLRVCAVLNCGAKVAGSCYGGSASGTYDFIKNAGPIPYDSGMPYSACSSDSTEGFCSKADWTCTPLNVARTCPTFGEPCVGLSHYPNATVAGTIYDVPSLFSLFHRYFIVFDIICIIYLVFSPLLFWNIFSCRARRRPGRGGDSR